MEVTGKIIAALKKREGVSQTTGKPWAVAPYVLETEEEYPKKVAFDVFGEERIERFGIRIGDNIRVHVDIDAREYNNRWYNQIRAWSVEHIDARTAGIHDIIAHAVPTPADATSSMADGAAPEQLPF